MDDFMARCVAVNNYDATHQHLIGQRTDERDLLVARMMELVPDRGNVATCDNCGRIEHTLQEERACIESMTAVLETVSFGPVAQVSA